jgi:hypothetical protein
MMLSFFVKLAQPIVDHRYVGFHSETKAVHIGKECAPDDDEVQNGDIFKDRLKIGTTRDLPHFNNLESLFFAANMAKSHQCVNRQRW